MRCAQRRYRDSHGRMQQGDLPAETRTTLPKIIFKIKLLHVFLSEGDHLFL